MLRVVSLKIIPTRTSVSARGAYNIEGTPCRSISGGTFFWIDPAEDLAAVLMTQMPGATRAYYRRLVKQLVYQAITDSAEDGQLLQ